MSGRLLVVVALSGCDRLLGLGTVAGLTDAPSPPPGPDSHLPACLVTPPPFLCADFDDTPAVLYGDGVAAQLPVPGPGIIADAKPPAVSAPNALWIDTTAANAGTYRAGYSSTTPGITKLHAELDLDVDLFTTPNATEIFELGIDQNTATHCYVQLQLDPMPRVNIRSMCANATGTAAEIFGAIPVSFTHYAIDIDVAKGTASATIQGVTTSIMLPVKYPSGGTPHAAAGVFFINNGGPRLAFDNVLVTAP